MSCCWPPLAACFGRCCQSTRAAQGPRKKLVSEELAARAAQDPSHVTLQEVLSSKEEQWFVDLIKSGELWTAKFLGDSFNIKTRDVEEIKPRFRSVQDIGAVGLQDGFRKQLNYGHIRRTSEGEEGEELTEKVFDCELLYRAGPSDDNMPNMRNRPQTRKVFTPETVHVWNCRLVVDRWRRLSESEIHPVQHLFVSGHPALGSRMGRVKTETMSRRIVSSEMAQADFQLSDAIRSILDKDGVDPSKIKIKNYENCVTKTIWNGPDGLPQPFCTCASCFSTTPPAEGTQDAGKVRRKHTCRTLDYMEWYNSLEGFLQKLLVHEDYSKREVLFTGTSGGGVQSEINGTRFALNPVNGKVPRVVSFGAYRWTCSEGKKSLEALARHNKIRFAHTIQVMDAAQCLPWKPQRNLYDNITFLPKSRSGNQYENLWSPSLPGWIWKKGSGAVTKLTKEIWVQGREKTPFLRADRPPRSQRGLFSTEDCFDLHLVFFRLHFAKSYTEAVERAAMGGTKFDA